ncbi:Nn.00g032610.m01.CDS01 [Neocucurbitaria sp. VM-36]
MPDMHPRETVTYSALFTTPISPALLEEEDRVCSICHEAYMEPTTSPDSHDPGREWPVRVDMVAEQSGPKRCCGHILGRRCLEKHLQSRGEWRNKCPVCRDLWFGNSTVSDTSTREEPQASAQSERRAPNPLRRSSRIALQTTARRRIPGLQMDEPHRVIRLRQRVQPSRSTSFMQQLLGALEVEQGSDEVKATLEEVEQRLEALYGSIPV